MARTVPDKRDQIAVMLDALRFIGSQFFE